MIPVMIMLVLGANALNLISFLSLSSIHRVQLATLWRKRDFCYNDAFFGMEEIFRFFHGVETGKHTQYWLHGFLTP